MIILAKAMSILFIVCFTYTMVASYIIRRFVDETKIKEYNYEKQMFRTNSPPLKVLTKTGARLWWSKWIALAISLVALACSYVLFQIRW